MAIRRHPVTVESIALKRTALSPHELIFLRSAMQLTQDEMATLVDLRCEYLARAERGRVTLGYASERLIRLAAVLDCCPKVTRADIARAVLHRERPGFATKGVAA